MIFSKNIAQHKNPANNKKKIITFPESNRSGNKKLLVGSLEFKLTVFGVHKDMSNSYREGTTQKLKSMALPYKTEVRQKS